MIVLILFAYMTFGRNNNPILFYAHMATFFTMHSLMLLQIFVLSGSVVRLNVLRNQLMDIFNFSGGDHPRVKLVFNEEFSVEAVRGSILVFNALLNAMKDANKLFSVAVSNKLQHLKYIGILLFLILEYLWIFSNICFCPFWIFCYLQKQYFWI